MNEEIIQHIEHFDIFYNERCNVWTINDNSEHETLGSLKYLEDAKLLVAAKLNGVIVIGEREKVPAPKPIEKIVLNREFFD